MRTASMSSAAINSRKSGYTLASGTIASVSSRFGLKTSLIATTSMSSLSLRTERKLLRPRRPQPMTPRRILSSSDWARALAATAAVAEAAMKTLRFIFCPYWFAGIGRGFYGRPSEMLPVGSRSLIVLIRIAALLGSSLGPRIPWPLILMILAHGGFKPCRRDGYASQPTHPTLNLDRGSIQ